MKAFLSLKKFTVLFCALLPLSAYAETSPGETMSRQILVKRNLDGLSESLETRVIRVNFPPGFKTPLHTHDAQGPRYILKGRLKVEDHGVTQTYGPGDTFWETGAEMTIQNVGGSDAEMVIFEVAGKH